jgi:uncharacterized cupin superfamily protein
MSAWADSEHSFGGASVHSHRPTAIIADPKSLNERPARLPAVFLERLAGRHKYPLGDLFGLSVFGVNLTRLEPGAASALRHAHSLQDEFVYVLQGHPTLRTGGGPVRLSPGMCAGFKAGLGDAHHLVNETDREVLYLEVGDRGQGDEVTYPDDDLRASLVEGRWVFSRKDGTPYPVGG